MSASKSFDMALLAFILAFLLWVVYVFFYTSRWLERYYHSLRSFGSGLLIAVIFAEILPLLFVEASAVVEWRFLATMFLLGFLLYHILEKHTYQHARSYKIHKEITYLHTSGFWADNFIKGLILFIFFTLNPFGSNPLLLFGALFISIVSNALNFRNFNERHIRLPVWLVAFVSLSVLFGAFVAALISPSQPYLYLTLAFISGAFTYFVIRDEIPTGKQGKPLFFMLGVLFFILFLLYLG